MAILAGDIMIKHQVVGDAVGNVIRVGQLLSRGPSTRVHAGIAYSPRKIIEMDGEGLKRNLLSANASAGYQYDVFRPKKNERLGRAAAAVAEMMWRGVAPNANASADPKDAVPGTMKIQYAARAAACSVTPNLIGRLGFLTADQSANNLASKWIEALNGGEGGSFFCSQHVVLCYQIAGRQMLAQVKRLQKNDDLADRQLKAHADHGKKIGGPERVRGPGPENVLNGATGRFVLTSDVVTRANQAPDPEAPHLVYRDNGLGIPAGYMEGVEVSALFTEDAKEYAPAYLWKHLWENSSLWERVGVFKGDQRVGDIVAP